jgi:1-pyrroline-5-carboxylate dehydrogenase
MLDLPTAIPLPSNEPVLTYAPGSSERAAVKTRLATFLGDCPELPHIIGGEAIFDGVPRDIVAPHRRHHVLARSSDATAGLTTRAVAAARAAAASWARTPFEERARIFLKAADLLAGPRRATLVAATMLGQSKTVYQAEIDAACELIDFLRFNVSYASRLLDQPASSPGVRNLLEARPLEGFVLAVTPFNFTAIAGNLPFAPALLGNVVVWKCAETQGLAAHHTMRLFEEAGLPPGVINLLYGPGAPVSEVCLAEKDLAGIHFTGSTQVFQSLWRGVGERIERYRSYPRLVGETGGKDFVFAHPSADEDSLVTALVRGAFEYQGQKCSAASRAYLPRSIFQRIEGRLIEETAALAMGDVTDFSNFLGAVIDGRAFLRHTLALAEAKADPSCRVLVGGGLDDGEGYFVRPTIVVVNQPDHVLLRTELFGPILTIFVYDDDRIEETLTLVDETSPYALTGAIFSQDRAALMHILARLRQAAGNVYLNDKPTGAVVGQQPFGGARGSGTNDKAGSALNLLRWCSPRTIKESWVPATSVAYPHQRPDDDAFG